MPCVTHRPPPPPKRPLPPEYVTSVSGIADAVIVGTVAIAVIVFALAAVL